VAAGFLPWTRFDIHTPPNTVGFTVSGGGYGNAFGSWQGVAVTAVFGVVGLVLYLAGRWEWKPSWRPIPMMAASVAVITLCGWLLWDLAHPLDFKISQPALSNDNPFAGLQQAMESVFSAMMPQMIIQVRPQAGPYLAMGLGTLLVLLAAWAIYTARQRSVTGDVAKNAVSPL
jgi:multisubunit Na+/H+ antiporter MnhB subunit